MCVAVLPQKLSASTNKYDVSRLPVVILLLNDFGVVLPAATLWNFMGQSNELNDSTGCTHRPAGPSTTSCLFLNPRHQVSQLSDNRHPLAPSKIEWDLTNGPLSKLLELLDTQV